MDERTRAKFEARATILKAMAHPSRLCVLEELARGPRCVRDLTDLIGSDMSTVSKHLSILKNAGIVDTDKQGTQVYYRLIAPCVLNFFNCIESVLQDQVQTQIRLLG